MRFIVYTREICVQDYHTHLRKCLDLDLLICVSFATDSLSLQSGPLRVTSHIVSNRDNPILLILTLLRSSLGMAGTVPVRDFFINCHVVMMRLNMLPTVFFFLMAVTDHGRRCPMSFLFQAPFKSNVFQEREMLER